MAIFGVDPEKSTMLLTRGADFTTSLKGNSPWPEGTNWFISFPEMQKVVMGKTDTENATVEFRMEEKETTAEALPNGTVFKIFCQFPGEPTTEQCLYLGKVKRRD